MTDDLREQTRNAYDAVASDYAAMIPDTTFEAPLDLAMVDEFVRLVAARPSPAVLDAGCGAGRMVTYLRSASSILEITGIDLSARMIALARTAHPDVQFERSDIRRTPFPDERFDGVLAWYSIIHLEPAELSGSIVEFARLLQPGGFLLLGYQAGLGERRVHRPYGHDVELRAFLHRTDDAVGALTRNGFGIIARLDRAPRTNERHSQGFILARRL